MNVQTLQVNDKLYMTVSANDLTRIFDYPRAVIYHDYQNSLHHSIANWKLYLHIHLEHINRAWELLCVIFYKYELFSMEFSSPEIAISIPMYQKRLSGLSADIIIDKDIWFAFIDEVTKVFNDNNIKAHAINSNHYRLNKYFSLKNDAYCHLFDNWAPPVDIIWPGYNYLASNRCQWIYPPTEYGYNAHNDAKPFKKSEWRSHWMRRIFKCRN
jgi:hypothetical protein